MRRDSPVPAITQTRHHGIALIAVGLDLIIHPRHREGVAADVIMCIGGIKGHEITVERMANPVPGCQGNHDMPPFGILGVIQGEGIETHVRLQRPFVIQAELHLQVGRSYSVIEEVVLDCQNLHPRCVRSGAVPFCTVRLRRVIADRALLPRVLCFNARTRIILRTHIRTRKNRTKQQTQNQRPEPVMVRHH